MVSGTGDLSDTLSEKRSKTAGLLWERLRSFFERSRIAPPANPLLTKRSKGISISEPAQPLRAISACDNSGGLAFVEWSGSVGSPPRFRASRKAHRLLRRPPHCLSAIRPGTACRRGRFGAVLRSPGLVYDQAPLRPGRLRIVEHQPTLRRFTSGFLSLRKEPSGPALLVLRPTPSRCLPGRSGLLRSAGSISPRGSGESWRWRVPRGRRTSGIVLHRTRVGFAGSVGHTAPPASMKLSRYPGHNYRYSVFTLVTQSTWQHKVYCTGSALRHSFRYSALCLPPL